MKKGIYQDKNNGTWYIKIKRNGTYITKRGFASKHEADISFDEIVYGALSRKHLETLLTIENIWNDYVERRKLLVSAGTLVCDRSNYVRHIKPFFDTKILNINNIKEYYKYILNSELSGQKKNKVISTFRDIMKTAYLNKKINADFYQDIDILLVLPKYKRNENELPERNAWTNEEIEKFFSVIPQDSIYYVLFAVFFELGCRIGELLGLLCKDYDTNTRKIAITRQRIHINGQGYTNTNKLKTSASYRTILLSEENGELLKEYLDITCKKPNDLIFPVHRNTLRRRMYEFEEMAGIPHHIPHSIRHTSAVNFCKSISNYHELEIASRRLGNSPEIFMHTYAKHISDNEEADLLKKVKSRSNSGSATTKNK